MRASILCTYLAGKFKTEKYAFPKQYVSMLNVKLDYLDNELMRLPYSIVRVYRYYDSFMMSEDLICLIKPSNP